MALAHAHALRHAGDLRNLGGISANSTVAGNVPDRTHLCSSRIAEYGRLIYGNLSNGDDGFALVEAATDFVILDIIGDWNGDPAAGGTLQAPPMRPKSHPGT